MEELEKIDAAVQFINKKIEGFKPSFGIILGTGLGSLTNDIDLAFSIDYKIIPHFPVSTVETHSGKLLFGYIFQKPVVVMQGRFHYYEGYDMKQVTFPVRVMKMLGINALFVSNAAGGLKENLKIADLMIIRDHINLFPENPLRGANLDPLGDRFTDMSEPYNLNLIEKGKHIASRYNLSVHEGIYAGVQGPNLETPAEYDYLRIIGADAVGMSTIPENIVARHMGLPVFAISVITDLCYGKIEPIDVPKIIAAAQKAEPGMKMIIEKLIETMP